MNVTVPGPDYEKVASTFYYRDKVDVTFSTAILLIGGCKVADKRFYSRMIPLADKLYEDYLIELRKEELI